jgi:hypothetical protein
MLIIVSGCHSQAKLSDEPVYFVDSDNGKGIESVLVIPLYSSFSGISTGAGDGPSKGTSGLLLSNPFIYSNSLPFIIEQPLSSAIAIPPFVAVVEKGVSVKGITAIAKGYQPEFFSIHRLYERTSAYKLKPLCEKEVKVELARISSGLQNKKYEVFLPNFSLYNDDRVIECDFSEEELAIVKAFIGIE